MLDRLRTARGVMRSLGVYYGRKSRGAEKDRLYAQFVRPGDLVFDVGAHVGDRVASFRRLGARVVAIEPQPALAFTLKALYGRDRNVTIESQGGGKDARHAHDEDQHRQSDGVDGIERFHRRRQRRARLGGAGLGEDDRGAR